MNNKKKKPTKGASLLEVYVQQRIIICADSRNEPDLATPDGPFKQPDDTLLATVDIILPGVAISYSRWVTYYAVRVRRVISSTLLCLAERDW